jgi:hypothetical protein
MSHPRSAVHRTILVVDVEGFSGQQRTNAHRLTVRKGLYQALQNAFRSAGIPWPDCHHEDRGDGVFVLVPPGIAKALLIESLPGHLASSLRRHNEAHQAQEQIRLRMALHAGEIIYDEHGATGASINMTFRLIEAKPLRSALSTSPAVLALIVSSWFFEDHSQVKTASDVLRRWLAALLEIGLDHSGQSAVW